MKEFGETLADTRKRSGLTQKELAEQVGIDHSYISKIERGINDAPTREKVLAIANVLGIPKGTQLAYFLLIAGCASAKDFEGLPTEPAQEKAGNIVLPFAAQTFHFPNVDRLEEENLLERIRELLSDTELSSECRAEYLKLLDRFVAWLEFQAREEREQNGQG